MFYCVKETNNHPVLMEFPKDIDKSLLQEIMVMKSLVVLLVAMMSMISVTANAQTADMDTNEQPIAPSIYIYTRICLDSFGESEDIYETSENPERRTVKFKDKGYFTSSTNPTIN